MIAALALTALCMALVLAGLIAGALQPRDVPPAPAAAETGGAVPRAQSAAPAAGASADGEGERRPPRGMGAIKRTIRAGEWRAVWPALVLISGMLGVMVFGAIACLIAFEQKATGVIMLILALFAVVSMAIDYRRA